MPVCFCCLSSEEKVHMIMTTFGALQRLDQIDNSEFPQFLCGRILPIDGSVLCAPISGKPCGYYEAFVEEQQERTDENGMLGIPDPDEPNKVWLPLYGEVKAVDFAIVDPQFPDLVVHVPGSRIPINVLANEDTITRSRLRSKLIVRDQQKQESTMEFLQRANINIEGHKRVLRFREANFEQGEQIAILGVVGEVDSKLKFFKAVDKTALSDEFFTKKGLSEWDRKAFLEVTEQPCLLVTDMEKYFQGLRLEELAQNVRLAKPLPAPEGVAAETMGR